MANLLVYMLKMPLPKTQSRAKQNQTNKSIAKDDGEGCHLFFLCETDHFELISAPSPQTLLG